MSALLQRWLARISSQSLAAERTLPPPLPDPVAQSAIRIEAYLWARKTPPHPKESNVIDSVTVGGRQFVLLVSDIERVLSAR